MKQEHVDDFIYDFEMGDADPNLGDVSYARWILLHFRLPAVTKLQFDKFIEGKKLFCTHKNERYRCTLASRLGDVGLTKNFNQDTGYQIRVPVNDCVQWSDKE